MTYSTILSSVAALAIAYIFFVYAIDIGTRAVKLGVLQLISPVPVVLRIFPNTKKSFDTWFSNIKKTYLELFIRVAVIFFALEIVKLVPIFISIIFHSQDGSMAGGFTKCLATVILIFGILRFAQEAVPLFKEIFSVGGNLLSGVNLKAPMPSLRHPIKSLGSAVANRMEDNKAAMWGLGKAAGMWGGVRSQFARQYNKNMDASIQANGRMHPFVSGTMAFPSALRGLVTGAKSGQTLSNFSQQGFRQANITGADAANKEFNESSRLQGYSQNQRDYLANKYGYGAKNPIDRAKNRFLNTVSYVGDNIGSYRGERAENKEERDYQREQYKMRIGGDYTASNAIAESLTGIVDGLSAVKANTKDKTKAISKRIDDLQQKANTSSVQTDPGAFTGVAPVQGTMSTAEYQQKMEEYRRQLDAHNARRAQYQEYLDTKNLIAAAKAERNDIIAKELSTANGKTFATNALDDVIDKIKKAPANALQDPSGTLEKVEALRTTANSTVGLSGADIKQLGDIIDDLNNAKIYAAEISKQQQNRTSSFNAPSSSSGGSSGGSGGSSGGSGGSSGGSGK